MTQRTDASERYAELRRLAEAATPGEWHADGKVLWVATERQIMEARCCGNGLPSGECCGNPIPDQVWEQEQTQIGEGNEDDIAFAAAAHNTLLVLLADNKSLREALEQLADVIDAAGLHNLTDGVQLGPTVWYVKAQTAMDYARAALASALPDPKENKQP